MSHSFSMSYVKEMEQHLDSNIKILRAKISHHASNDEAFDLKKVLHYYTIDVLGELAFSQSFGIQESNDESRIPPVIEHSLLAALTGAWPAMTANLKKWLPIIPHKGLQALFKGRKACADLASRCVNVRLNALRSKGGLSSDLPERKDILTNLINAKHPDTGESLTQTDLETEAFGFMYVLIIAISSSRGIPISNRILLTWTQESRAHIQPVRQLHSYSITCFTTTISCRDVSMRSMQNYRLCIPAKTHIRSQMPKHHCHFCVIVSKRTFESRLSSLCP